MAQLICRDVMVGYDTGAVASNINFQVDHGDYLCIVGANGAGKSTLMKTLLGLAAPLAGEIIFGDGLLQKEIGYLPQQTAIQKNFPASVREVVLSGCLNQVGLRPFYSQKEKLTAKSHMERLGIISLEKQGYMKLSGGQQQRVLLARALCATRKMLLLDEPVSGLDPIAMNEMYQYVDRINKEEKITIIMVTHDINAAIRYASHILHVDRSQMFFGTTGEYMKENIGFADQVLENREEVS